MSSSNGRSNHLDASDSTFPEPGDSLRAGTGQSNGGAALGGDVRDDQETLASPRLNGKSKNHGKAPVRPSNRRATGPTPTRPYDLVNAAVSAVREPYGLPGDPARESMPELLAYLTDRQYPNSRMRDVPKVTLVATATGWAVRMVDNKLSVAFEANFEHLGDLLEVMQGTVCGRLGRCVTVAYGKGYQKLKSKEEKELGKE